MKAHEQGGWLSSPEHRINSWFLSAGKTGGLLLALPVLIVGFVLVLLVVGVLVLAIEVARMFDRIREVFEQWRRPPTRGG